MSNIVVNRRGIPLLGREERAEGLVMWSEDNVPGKRLVKNFPFGLRLGFVAAGLEPKMYIHWNQQKLFRFLKTLKQTERFFVTAFGICVEHHQGITRICLLGAGKTGAVLWDSLSNPFSRQHSFDSPEDEVNWLVGMVRFSEMGPILLRQAECQQELEEATALAIVHKEAAAPKQRVTQSVGQVLPKPTPLATETQQFLLRDVLLNLILHAKEGKSA